MTSTAPPLRTVDRLRRQLREWERSRGTHSPPARGPAVRADIAAVDRLLLAGGHRPGSLVEWLAEGEGTGAATLVLSCFGSSLSDGRPLIVVDEAGNFHPPGLPAAIDPERVVVVRPRTLPDAWWAVEQSLRCPGTAITLAWVNRADDRTLRRWQLAAERGGGVGLLLRPVAARRTPSWADARWLVEPLPSFSESHGRRWRLELLHRRGRLPGGAVELEQDHETGAVRVASRLAVAEATGIAAGA